jgi:HSP20 family protein
MGGPKSPTKYEDEWEVTTMMWRNLYGNGNRRRPGWPGYMLREMRRMQEEMDHLLGGTTGQRTTRFPAMNAWTGADGVVVTAEIPGINPDDIEITVVGETLTVSGRRPDLELPEEARYHRRERGTGEFSRTLELPFRVDAESVSAHFRNGVLEIALPRLAEEMPKKIAVKSAE